MDYKTIMAEFEAGFKFKEVNKRGNMWEARIRDPKLKIEVYLGYYSTPQEAAIVVKKKKAEFENTLKAEAAVVADRKRAELHQVYGEKPRDDDDEVLLECESEVTGDFESEDNSPCVGDKRVIDQISPRKTACSLDEKAAVDTTACYYSPTSVLDTENSSHSPADELNDTMGEVPFNLNVEPGNVCNVDEAVRFVTINEYGQLLGEFSFLDETIWLGM